MEERKKPFSLSLWLLLGISGAEFLCKWSNQYPSANMFRTHVTGSICDVSAASPEIAPTGPTASSDFLRDLLSCTDTDKSPHKSDPRYLAH